MQDRVGEVLAERAALDGGPAAGLALSVVMHTAVVGIVIYAAIHQPPPQTESVINIKFMQTPRAAPPAVITPATAAPVTPAPIPAPQPKPAEKKTAPPSPFGRSEKKPGELPAPPSTTTQPRTAAPVAQVQPAAPVVPVGGAGVTGLEGGDFPYTIYIDNMKRLVGSHWFRPQVTGDVTTTIYFFINRDGTIRDAKNETTSNNGTFDRAALRAVLEASPLPPLPFAYSGSYLGVHLTFR